MDPMVEEFSDLLELVGSVIDMIDSDLEHSCLLFYDKETVEELSFRKWGAKELETFILAKMTYLITPCELMEWFITTYTDGKNKIEDAQAKRRINYGIEEVTEIYDMYICESD